LADSADSVLCRFSTGLGLESLDWDKHSGGSKLLTGGVNFWFHSDFEAHRLWTRILARLDSSYHHPLGSRHLSQEPSQWSLERYRAGSCTTGQVKKKEPIIMEDSSYAYLLDWQKLNLTLVLSRGIGAGNGLEAESLILIPDALFLTSFCGFF
jgi:hypothetical protein